MPSFPNGCHICEVEVDPETGAVQLDRYTVVDDIGTGRQPPAGERPDPRRHRPGRGQALIEDVLYDRGSGQLLTGSLMDYSIPRADNLPAIAIDFSPVPSLSNPLGIKGVGEGWHGCRDADGDERDPRCAGTARRHRRRDAGIRGEGVAGN